MARVLRIDYAGAVQYQLFIAQSGISNNRLLNQL
jgi:hypothetical protein